MTALVAGAAVTVLAAVSAPAALTATVAGGIVVMEGAQQIFQFHSSWISYRATAETLRQHAFLYSAVVSPYDQADRRDRLATLVKDVTTKESTTWSQVMQTQTEPQGRSV